MLQNEVVYAAAGLESFLGDFRGILISDDRIKSRNHANAVVHIAAAAVGICGDTVDAAGTGSMALSSIWAASEANVTQVSLPITL